MELDTTEKLISFGGVIALLGGGIKWLLADRKATLELLDAERAKNEQARDQLIAELKASAELLATSGEVVRDSLSSFEKQLKELERAMKGSDQSVVSSINALTKSIDELRSTARRPP